MDEFMKCYGSLYLERRGRAAWGACSTVKNLQMIEIAKKVTKGWNITIWTVHKLLLNNSVLIDSLQDSHESFNVG